MPSKTTTDSLIVETLVADSTGAASLDLRINGQIEVVKIEVLAGQAVGAIATVTNPVTGDVIATKTAPGTVAVKPVVQATTNAGVAISGEYVRLFATSLSLSVASATPGNAAKITIQVSR